MATMSNERISELNRAVFAVLGLPARNAYGDNTISESDEGAYEAVMQVVKEHELELVRDNGDEAKVYRDRDGLLVNVWIGGNSLGFDDQIDQ